MPFVFDQLFFEEKKNQFLSREKIFHFESKFSFFSRISKIIFDELFSNCNFPGKIRQIVSFMS